MSERMPPVWIRGLSYVTFLFSGGLAGRDSGPGSPRGSAGDASEDRKAGGAVVLSATKGSTTTDPLQHRRHPTVRSARLHHTKTAGELQRISLHLYFRLDHYFLVGGFPTRLFYCILYVPSSWYFSFLFNFKCHCYVVVPVCT